MTAFAHVFRQVVTFAARLSSVRSRGTSVALFVLGAVLFAACRSEAPVAKQDANSTASHQELIVSNAKVTVVSLAVTPPTSSIPATVQTQLKATATYSNGTTKTLTTGISWSTSDGTIASVSSTGLVAGLLPGAVTITATDVAAGVSGTAPVTVTTATLVSVALTPAAKTLPTIGTTARFVATGTFSDGTTANLLGAVTWSSTDASVAGVSATGVATASQPGTVAIEAVHTATGLRGKATLTVGSATLASLAVTPGQSSLPAGLTESFVATGTYSDGTTMDLTSAATWAVSAPLIATVSNDPSTIGTVTAIKVGKATITATLSGKKGSSALTVTAATIASIAVTPAVKSVIAGNTLHLTATGTFSDRSTKNVTTKVTWSSSSAGLSVSNATGSNGLATALGNPLGEATVYASLGSVSGTAGIDVISSKLVSVSVQPASLSTPLGLPKLFTATGNYADGSSQDISELVTWSTGSTSIATISNASSPPAGLATPVALGSTTVTALEPSSGIKGNASLVVTPAALVAAIIYPPDEDIANGLTQQFSVIGTYTDASQQDLTNVMTWSVLAPGLATISNAQGSRGLANTGSVGVNTIQALDPTTHVVATTTLTVDPAVLEFIAIAPANAAIYDGTSQQLSAQGTWTDGTITDLTTSATWQSNDPSVTVTAGGLATASSTGSSLLSATDTASGLVGYTRLNALGGSNTQCAGQVQGTVCGGSAGACGTQTVCDGAGNCSVPAPTAAQTAQQKACLSAFESAVLVSPPPDSVTFQQAEDALFTCNGLPTSCEVPLQIAGGQAQAARGHRSSAFVEPNAEIYSVPCIDVPTGQKCIEQQLVEGLLNLAGAAPSPIQEALAGYDAILALRQCPSQNCASNNRCVTGSAGTLCCPTGQVACGSNCMDPSGTCCTSGDGMVTTICGPGEACYSCSAQIACAGPLGGHGVEICCGGQPCFGQDNLTCDACGL